MLVDDGQEIVGEISYTITWSGADYSALIADPSVIMDLSEGGFMPEGDFRIQILRADFNSGAGPFPDNNDVVTFNGDDYVVKMHRQLPASAFIELMIATNF